MAKKARIGVKLRMQARRRAAAGTSPGTLIADPHAQPTRLSFIGYSPDAQEHHHGVTVDQIAKARPRFPAMWINVDGLADVKTVEELGNLFDLHPLALEDVINVHQRPKAEEYPGNIYIVLRMPRRDSLTETEQLSIFLGKDFVVTFQEREGDWFDPVRARLAKAGTRIRSMGSDYLAYALIDAAVDGYFPNLDKIGDALEGLEDKLLRDSQGENIQDLHHLRHVLTTVRRGIWPQRDMLNSLMRLDNPLLSEHIGIYLRDCYDHSVQLMDFVETYRDIVTGLYDLNFTNQSNRMNEVMKVLTIIATIFIPLSFIAGLYGMNFDTSSPFNLPELGWRYGYVFALSLMLLCAGGMMFLFRRWGWLGGRSGRKN